MIREHRKQLVKEGYISCTKNQHSQTIVIHNWTNPRAYDGIVQNQSEEKNELKESESLGESNGESVLEQACFSDASYNHIPHNTLKDLTEPERIPVAYVNNEYVEVDEIKETKPKHGANYRSLMSAIASVCKMDISIRTQASQVGKAAKELDVAGYTPDQVYDFLDWWKRNDWRWAKNQRHPAPHELLNTISKSIVVQEKELTDEELREMGYIK